MLLKKNIGIALNVLFVVVEVVFGLNAQSTALLADAGHNLIDVLSLLLAWSANHLATKKPGGNFTYGYRKTTILSSLLNGIFLIVAAIFIGYEAIYKIFHGSDVQGMTVIIVALIGVAVNTITALLFMKGQHEDLNIKGAFLHMAADAGVSLGVALAGLIIYYTHFTWIDPALSLLIVIFIIWSTWSLLKESVFLSLDAAPEKFDVREIEKELSAHPEVEDIHDLHVWALSTSQNALSAHVVSNEDKTATLLEDLNQTINKKFGIHHVTIQIEKDTAHLHCDCMNKAEVHAHHH